MDSHYVIVKTLICAISKSGDGGKGVDKEGHFDVGPHAHTMGGLHADCQEVRFQGPGEKYFKWIKFFYILFGYILF